MEQLNDVEKMALKAIISIVLVAIFLYLIITAIQRYLAANEEVDKALKEVQKASEESYQAQQELAQTANEYIQAENERRQRIGEAVNELNTAQSNLDELNRQYEADVAQRTAEGCTAKQFYKFGHTLWSCPVK